MSEEPKVHPAEGGFEGQGTFDGDAIVVTVKQLPQTLKENRQNIIVKMPWWLPYPLAFLLICIIMMACGQLSVFQGLKLGYNVEQCSKIRLKGGEEFSHCVKLTKPSVQK
jgi:hypothetical protein